MKRLTLSILVVIIVIVLVLVRLNFFCHILTCTIQGSNLRKLASTLAFLSAATPLLKQNS
jgi:hypothetical protein